MSNLAEFPKLKLDGYWPAEHISCAITLLHHAAERIRTLEGTFICTGIGTYRGSFMGTTYIHDVTIKLRDEIHDALGPYMTFAAWLGNNGYGYYVDPRKARLEWIGLMIRQLEELHGQD